MLEIETLWSFLHVGNISVEMWAAEMNFSVDHTGIKGLSNSWLSGSYWNNKWQQGRRTQDMFCCGWGFRIAIQGAKNLPILTQRPSECGYFLFSILLIPYKPSCSLQGCFWDPPKPFLCPLRVKAAQNELGQQILADFEEAFPSQGTKVKFSLSLFLPLKSVTENSSGWLCYLF